MQMNSEIDTWRNRLMQLLPSGVGVFDVKGDKVVADYFNDGYYTMLGTTREERAKYLGEENKNNIVCTVKEEDVPGLLVELKKCVEEKRQFRYKLRIFHADGEYKWIEIRANHVPMGNGMERYFSSYFYIDDIVKANEKSAEAEKTLSEFLIYSDTVNFVYYPDTHKYVANVLPEKFAELKKTMDDFPESFIKYADLNDEDAQKYREMVARIDAGEERAECTFFGAYMGIKSWYKVQMTSFLDENGKCVRAIGSATNIDKYVESQRALNEERMKMHKLHRNILSTGCFNVTRDSVIEINNNKVFKFDKFEVNEELLKDAEMADPLVRQQKRETLEILLRSMQQIPDEKQRHLFVQMTSHFGFLKLFESGRREVEYEYRRIVNGSLIWVMTQVSLVLEPETDELLAFVYTYDVNQGVIHRKISEKLITNNYESLSFFDMNSGHLYVKNEGISFNEIEYGQAMNSLLENGVCAEDVERVRVDCSLERVIAGLENCSVYSVVYGTKDSSKSIKNDAFYLDENQDIIVFIQSDATVIEEMVRANEQAKVTNTLVNSIPAGIAVYRRKDGETQILKVNKYLTDLVKFSELEITASNLESQISDSVHRDDVNVCFEGMERIFGSDKVESFTYRTRIGNSTEYLWINATGKSNIDANGDRIAYVVYTDATEQKQREKEYDMHIHEVSAMNPQTLGVYHFDTTANEVLRVQTQIPELPSVRSSYNKSADEVIKDILSSFIDETTFGMCSEEISNCSSNGLTKLFENGKKNFHCEHRMRFSKTGETKWVTAYINMDKNPRSGHVEVIVCIVDTNESVRSRLIMERISGEDYDFLALVDVKRHVRTMLRIKDNSKLNFDDKYVRYDSDVADALYRGMNEDDATEMFRLISFDAVIHSLNESPTYSISFSLRNEEGEVRRKQLTYRWLDDTHELILSTRVDITETYLQEQEQMKCMEETLMLAEEANRSKTEFISRISHDIRTPISIIKSMTEFAFEDIDDKEKLTSDLDKISTANTFLLSLINDVLDISKIDSGKIELSPEPYTYEEHSRNVRNVLETMCAQKGVNCVIERRNTTGTIVADKIRMNQITLNLISNAVKYTPAGGTVTYISDSKNLPDNQIRFGMIIKDTGIGMKKEFVDRMFEPFAQEYDNPNRPKGTTGTGLGLAIVKRIVDLMGGTLSVESTLGEGTTISCYITFPDAERDPNYYYWRNSHTSAPVAVKPTQLTGRILLAEDNQINYEIAKRIISNFGVEMDYAENGQQALSLFEKSAPSYYSAIFMDIQMPIMNGYEASIAIRSSSHPDAQTIPIIAVTADAFSEAVTQALDSGMTSYITKPLDPNMVYSKLANYLPRDTKNDA